MKKTKVHPVFGVLASLSLIEFLRESEVESKERSDACAVEAMGVVAEAEVAMVLADAYTKMFGDNCLADIIARRDAYLDRIAQR